MTSSPASSRRSRRTLIAVGVLAFVILALVTISPLRSYVTGAATRDRGTDETSYVIAAAGDIVCSSRMQREVQERAERLQVKRHRRTDGPETSSNLCRCRDRRFAS